MGCGGFILLALFVYLIGNSSIPLWDRDEPRYTVASREMAQSGDWVRPTFLGEPRLNKPIFIYWLQAGSMTWLGESPFAARLPSAIAMTLTLSMLAYVLPKIVGRRRAFWTVFVLGSSVLVISAAKIALTDAVLLLWITTAQLCLYAIWRGKGTWLTCAIFAAAIGLALLTKGPVVLAMLATTIAALAVLQWITPGRTQRRSFSGDSESMMLAVSGKVLMVLAIIAAIGLPWVLAIEARQPGWLVSTIGGEVVKRGTAPMENHGGWPGYYATLIWATFFPWSIFLIAALVLGFKLRASPFTRFALAAVVGPWVMLEIYATKLPHYLLPAYPFLAFLVANVISLARRRLTNSVSDKPYMIAVSIGAGVVTLVALGLVLIPAMSDGESGKHYFAMIAMMSFIIGSAWYAVFKLSEKRVVLAGAFMGLATMVGAVMLGVMYLPHTKALQVSERVARVLADNGGTGPSTAGKVVMVGYKEPSLGFYQGGTIREEEHADFLARTPQEKWPTWVVSDTTLWEAKPEQIKKQFKVLGRVRGLNVAQGPRADVTVLRRIATGNANFVIELPATRPIPKPPKNPLAN